MLEYEELITTPEGLAQARCISGLQVVSCGHVSQNSVFWVNDVPKRLKTNWSALLACLSACLLLDWLACVLVRLKLRPGCSKIGWRRPWGSL